MITANVFHRVLLISFGEQLGTAFAIDLDGRQYLVTARHVVDGLRADSKLKVMHQGKWNDLDVQVVGHGTGLVDISVLAAQAQIAPTLPLPVGSDGLVVGQDMFFLGFPYGMIAEVGPINRGLPFPLVKKGTLSAVTKDAGGGHLLLLDGHNNPGFSGGPVVFSVPGTSATNLRVAGVVSAYRFERKPVMDEDRATQFAVHENTGIIITYDIRHAVEMIRGNPVGAIFASP